MLMCEMLSTSVVKNPAKEWKVVVEAKVAASSTEGACVSSDSTVRKNDQRCDMRSPGKGSGV
jgi:hypothetical protein